MPLFKVSRNKLKEVKEKNFNLEKDIQKVTENNLGEIFGYRFISSEFQLKNLRVDTLAFNEESKSFIIIEYKKDRNTSVIDQGFSYLSLMLNHKADFILEYNQETNSSIARNDVDWSQSRVVFVSPQFTTYQKGAMEFKDLAFELWEVKKYDNNTILYNHLKPAQTSESIKTVTANNTVRAVSGEIKTYTIEDHFKKGWDESRDLFDKLSERLLSLDSSIYVNPVKSYIGYKIRKDVYFAVHIRKSQIYIHFSKTKPKDLNDPQKKAKYIPNAFKYYNQHISSISIAEDGDIDYAVFLSKQVYERLNK